MGRIRYDHLSPQPVSSSLFFFMWTFFFWPVDWNGNSERYRIWREGFAVICTTVPAEDITRTGSGGQYRGRIVTNLDTVIYLPVIWRPIPGGSRISIEHRFGGHVRMHFRSIVETYFNLHM